MEPLPFGASRCISLLWLGACMCGVWLGMVACASPPRSQPVRTETTSAAVKGASVPHANSSLPDALKSPESKLETAVLAGGCFWGMEEIVRKIPGVQSVEVGYTGGTLERPRYEDTHNGASGHAEAVRLEFDPKQLSYADLLGKWFFRMHDPTTKNRQGNDLGSQYRSAIFYTTPGQRETAERVKREVNASGRWKSPIVTEISQAGPFWRAEEEHQDYLQKHPDGYTCHYLRDWI